MEKTGGGGGGEDNSAGERGEEGGVAIEKTVVRRLCLNQATLKLSHGCEF